MNIIKIRIMLFIFGALIPVVAYSHDTTHIHPLITEKISTLIELIDSSTKAYEEVYVELPDEQKDDAIQTKQRLYWGTDFDAGKDPDLLTQDWVLDNQFTAFHEPLNVINGVVQEDVPDSKVKNHFYHATTGTGLLTTRQCGRLG